LQLGTTVEVCCHTDLTDTWITATLWVTCIKTEHMLWTAGDQHHYSGGILLLTHDRSTSKTTGYRLDDRFNFQQQNGFSLCHHIQITLRHTQLPIRKVLMVLPFSGDKVTEAWY